MKMFNEVEIDEYEDDEFLSVFFLKSFEEPCSELYHQLYSNIVYFNIFKAYTRFLV